MLEVGESISGKKGALTGMALMEVLKKLPTEVLFKYVRIMSDEEGNSIAKLYSIDITENGIVLWPSSAEY